MYSSFCVASHLISMISYSRKYTKIRLKAFQMEKEYLHNIDSLLQDDLGTR